VTAPAGSRLPAEWEPQDAVQLTWPHAGTDWRDSLEEVVALYERLVALLVGVGDVLIGAPAAEVAQVRARLAGAGVPGARLHIFAVSSDDTWARDHGPITVQSSAGPCLLDYRFNGWGGKFDAELDDAITASLYRQGAYPGARLRRRALVLEGGAIESDGRGTLLTTSACLLNPNRNPALDQAEIEALLRADLGVRKVNWLRSGALEGDDTDSHIDTLARLCPGGVIAYQACDDRGDSHYPGLQAMAQELRQMRSAGGEHYRLLPLPWPAPKYDGAGRRLPATYANFLICNGSVLVPTYRDLRDTEALRRVAQAFPGYRVTGVDCLPLIQQHGSLHCITMQLPRGVLSGGAGASRGN
jgi:agmatine deiminase